jgi:hypothetical protein
MTMDTIMIAAAAGRGCDTIAVAIGAIGAIDGGQRG